jgi:hypothetical protein
MLIAKDLKPILSLYQKNLEFRPIVLVEQDEEKQVVYYLTEAPMLDCASSESALSKTGEIQQLVINKEKVGNCRIFEAAGFAGRLIVRLDVAESILRRNPYGIAFEKLKAGGQ